MKIEALAVRRDVKVEDGNRALARARARAFGEFIQEIPFAAALLDRDLSLIAVSRDWAAQGIAPDLAIGDDAGAGGLVASEDAAALRACAEEGLAFSRYLPGGSGGLNSALAVRVTRSTR
jgi:hypothetical protein